MSNKHQVLQNPDVPAEAIVKQLLVENGQLKSEIQYLENELANKNRAIKEFKKWQRDITQRTIEQWLKEATNLEEPLLSKEAYERIKSFMGVIGQAKTVLSRHKAVLKALDKFTQDSEIQQLLNNKE